MERIKIDDGSKTYEIVNLDDQVIGTFTFNPSDANIIKRYESVVDAIQEYAAKDEPMTPELLNEAQELITQKVSELVGVDTSKTFFSICGALSPMANGNLYVLNVIEALGAVIEKETNQRMKKVNAKMNKYLEGYK